MLFKDKLAFVETGELAISDYISMASISGVEPRVLTNKYTGFPTHGTHHTREHKHGHFLQKIHDN